MTDAISLLQQTPLFDGITREETAALCQAFGCRRAYYAKGSALWHREDSVSSAGIVLSGCVQAEISGADGTLRVIARHGPGALFGDVLMSSRGQKSPVDVVAAEDTDVLFLPLDEIMRDGEQPAARTRFRLNLLAELSDKYWALYRRIGCLSGGSLRSRIARRLLQEREDRGSDEVILSGTRETLAGELGVNRSALSRELGRLRGEGLIEMRRGRFRLLDPEALRGIAER